MSKKIKKLELIQLTQKQQKKIQAGCSCNWSSSNWDNPEYCEGSDPGGGGSDCGDLWQFCFPSDGTSSWLGLGGVLTGGY